jgi:hypothetical protein
VSWRRQPGLAVQPDPVRTVARCDNHNGARCDWRRLFRAGAVHSSRHPPITARQHRRWMPRRQGSAASLRIIRGVPLRLRPPVRLKGRADPGQRRPAIAAGHAVRSSARRELLSRNRLFGKRLRSFARFGLQHAQTSLLPLWKKGVDVLASPCVPSSVSSIRTSELPLLPAWEKGAGGMRGKRRGNAANRASRPRTLPLRAHAGGGGVFE